MVTGIIPHVGGVIIGPGAPTVLIAGLPASVEGDMCACVGPPATIVLGCLTVLLCGRPGTFLGSLTDHGGSVVLGVPTVMFGP